MLTSLSFQVNDLLVQVNGRKLEGMSVEQVNELISSIPAGTVYLELLSGEKCDNHVRAACIDLRSA